LAVFPFAIFGIDNNGVGVFANLLVIFLIAIWFALVFWTYSDARRRLEDGVLIGSATLASLIFPFAGSLVYTIVRPPETLDDAYERDLDVRAAELRVRLLESAVKGGPGSSQHAATLAGELQGEPTTGRRSAQPPSSGPPASGQGGSRRAEQSRAEQSRAEQSRAEQSRTEQSGSSQSGSGRSAQPGPSQPSSRPASGPGPSRSGQPQRPSSGNPSSSRPPIAGSDGA
jgi:hypothetical protein